MENMDAKGNDRKHYRGIEKQTDNPFLNLYHIDALGRDGTPFHYYFASRNDENNIKHKTHSMRPEGMAVYAVTEDGEKLVLVRQYRYPVNDYLYELPAGLIEPEETASEAACREMIEETGWKLEVYEGGEPAFRRGFFLAQGLTDESGSMIFGTVTENVGQQMENTEDIQVILADRQEVLRILREERVSMRCGLMLMQFLKTGAFCSCDGRWDKAQRIDGTVTREKQERKTLILQKQFPVLENFFEKRGKLWQSNI